MTETLPDLAAAFERALREHIAAGTRLHAAERALADAVAATGDDRRHEFPSDRLTVYVDPPRPGEREWTVSFGSPPIIHAKETTS